MQKEVLARVNEQAEELSLPPVETDADYCRHVLAVKMYGPATEDFMQIEGGIKKGNNVKNRRFKLCRKK